MHLIIGTPCYGGVVTQRYMQSICALLEYSRASGVRVSVELLGYDSLITRSRNTILTTFLVHEDATHLMFIDADISFHVEQVIRMLAFDEEIVAGVYPLKVINHDEGFADRLRSGEPIDTAQLRYVGAPVPAAAGEERDGFVTGEFAGAGFLLMKRSALETMAAAYPETQYLFAHNRTDPGATRVQHALFDCMIDPETKTYLSEDYAFCLRWRRLGGKIWLDSRSRLTHVGAFDFAGDLGRRSFGAATWAA